MNSPRLNVLVACEFSGVVREAFRRAGHDAVSCDLLASEIPGPHEQRDALEVLRSRQWDLVIAHPPCTYLCNSGVRWLYGAKGGSTVRDPVRWEAMERACEFFLSFFADYDGPLCVENPIMHKHGAALIESAGEICERKQLIQPWQFGHMESKGTYLWLRGLPALVPTNDVRAEMMKLPIQERNRVHLCAPGPERWAMRSRTFPGIAEAMAKQWPAALAARREEFSVSSTP